MKAVSQSIEELDEIFLKAATEVLEKVNVNLEIFGNSCETHLYNEEEPLTG